VGTPPDNERIPAAIVSQDIPANALADAAIADKLFATASRESVSISPLNNV
jgi:hypothetical protein